MAVAHDFVEEWKKLKPGGKIAVIGAFVAVAGYGLYQYEKNKGSTASTIAGTPVAPNTDTSGVTGVSGTSTGTPGLPLPPVPGPGTPPGGPSNPPTQGGGNPPLGNPPPSPLSNNPLIPYGFFASHQFPTSAQGPGGTFTYQGTQYLVTPGGGGRIWGQVLTPAQGGGFAVNPTKVLLYGPASQYAAPINSPNVVK